MPSSAAALEAEVVVVVRETARGVVVLLRRGVPTSCGEGCCKADYIFCMRANECRQPTRCKPFNPFEQLNKALSASLVILTGSLALERSAKLSLTSRSAL